MILELVFKGFHCISWFIPQFSNVIVQVQLLTCFEKFWVNWFFSFLLHLLVRLFSFLLLLLVFFFLFLLFMFLFLVDIWSPVCNCLFPLWLLQVGHHATVKKQRLYMAFTAVIWRLVTSVSLHATPNRSQHPKIQKGTENKLCYCHQF